jgi:hypothetical protein
MHIVSRTASETEAARQAVADKLAADRATVLAPSGKRSF